MEYITVCGLEVHIELSTKTKVFCSCSTEFGNDPNTQVCPVCLGMPGALPSLNKKVVEYAVKTGLALNCDITKLNKFDRKNYFYPDLPKAYQISQLYLPICRNGYIEVNDHINGGVKKIGISDIHIEEDAGKLIHDDISGKTLINYNRCGVPLLEIVTKPDISHPQEAVEFVQNLRQILKYCDVSDCKMQEGSLRVDVNVSVMPKDSDAFGTRTEMKNINSIKAVANAIDNESKRQVLAIENGEKIIQQTRRWDDLNNKSYAMRIKENPESYRYFPEPDIPVLNITDEYIEKIKSSLPEMPQDKIKRYMKDYNLSDYDAQMICSNIEYSKLFEENVKITNSPKDVANFIMGDVMKLVKENHIEPEKMNFNYSYVGTIISLINDNKITRDVAHSVFEKVFECNIEPKQYIEDNNLMIVNDDNLVKSVVKAVIENNQKAVTQYKDGKQNAFNFLVGQAMKVLKGKAQANSVKQILEEYLNDN